MRDIRKGFVYKRVPHVTLKSIANNEEIDAIHARWQEQLEPLRVEINRLARQRLGGVAGAARAAAAKTFEVSETSKVWADATRLHAEWWQARRDRQAQIDASIARRAETETLYDQPYEDNKRVRVSGPFTVESLSPHRVLPTDDPSTSSGQGSTSSEREARKGQDFAPVGSPA